MYDYLLNGLSEAGLIDDPQSGVLPDFNSGGSVNVVEEGQLSEPLSGFQCFDDDAIDDNFNNTGDDKEEAGSLIALAEDGGAHGDFGPPHIVAYIVDLCFGEVVEDEVVFEAGEDELVVGLGLGFEEGV